MALLYQGGYLTIDRRIDSETVVLRISNEEVRGSLYRGYVSELFGKDFELDDFSLTAKETAAELFADECRERRYADAYAAEVRRIVYVGVNYDPAVRTIGAVKTEPAQD